MTIPFSQALPAAFVVLSFCLAVAPLSASASGKSEATSEKEPTIRETMAQVGRIAEELKLIDARLQRLEKSVAGLEKSVAGVDTSLAGIDKSLGPVGNALKAEALREIVDTAGDVAHDRARRLILLAMACFAGLIVLHAVLRRWGRQPDRASGRADGQSPG